MKPPPESEIPKEEKDKYQEEFQNFQQELDKKKEEFQKEHPDVQGEPSQFNENPTQPIIILLLLLYFNVLCFPLICAFQVKITISASRVCANAFSFPFSVEDLYESVNDREIRQVFEGQNRIHLEIKQLHRQLAMILDEQRRYVSVITDEIGKKGTAVESGQVKLAA